MTFDCSGRTVWECSCWSFAPVVIIMVAGFSLGSIYGAGPGPEAYLIPVVDQDHGAIAEAIVDALPRESSLTIALTDDLARARDSVAERDRTPLAILIPAGMTEALKQGHTARLVVYVDPVKRIELSAIELRLNELCRQIAARAPQEARRKMVSQEAEIRARLETLTVQVKQLQSSIEDYRRQLVGGRARAEAALRAQIFREIAELETQTRAAIERSVEQTKSTLMREIASRGDALVAVSHYLVALQVSEREFDRWLAALKGAAGGRAAEIPPPPAFPTPPSKEQVAELTEPLVLLSPPLPQLPAPPDLAIRLPRLPPLPRLHLPADLASLPARGSPTFPGDLTWSERSLAGGRAEMSAFDQYVPGFGITFLLIAMLMGVGMGLIDERDWGTLQRLRVTGAPLLGVLSGKLMSRFLMGLFQMTVLFAVGWWVFGISLGRHPIMLTVPTAAISFAAAGFSLFIACVTRTHDSVMPVGAVAAMAMSAIGGCWWPLDFEPSWMRMVARWLPTTWTMRVYNDLMIHHAPAVSALWPSAAAAGLGLLYLAIGMIAASKLYE
jgi:ABC-type multidrug transport system permease subunit